MIIVMTSAITDTFFRAVRHRVARTPPHVALAVAMLRAFENEARVALVRGSRAEVIAVGIDDLAVLGRRQERTCHAYGHTTVASETGAEGALPRLTHDIPQS